MWNFLQRYFGWYLWLGLYSSALGGLVGVACITGPFILFLAPHLARVSLAALMFAAPLNLVVLPVAFHLARDSKRRKPTLRLVGGVAGPFSPIAGTIAWSVTEPGLSFLSDFTHDTITYVPHAIAGAIAGVICGNLFDKHGQKASLFDVNAALDGAE